ncbi:MAG: response regulator transcription factor [Lachnospiraceae bacterium]|nr:response regulator transcription factor [Lachnospiraceae bacterium]
MLRIAICDDEIQFQKMIKTILEEYLNTKEMEYSIDLYESGVDLLNGDIEVSTYDIVFLDINMAELDGLDVAKKIREYSEDIEIVFVTAYASYSMEGYKVRAVRYVLKGKGILKPALVECMDCIIEKNMRKKMRRKMEFAEDTKYLAVDNIMYIESELHKVKFYIQEDGYSVYTKYAKLDEIEDEFKEYKFIRMHKSYLVNPKYIKEITRYELKMTNGNILAVPKDKYKKVKDDYIAYKGEI